MAAKGVAIATKVKQTKAKIALISEFAIYGVKHNDFCWAWIRLCCPYTVF